MISEAFDIIQKFNFSYSVLKRLSVCGWLTFLKNHCFSLFLNLLQLEIFIQWRFYLRFEFINSLPYCVRKFLSLESLHSLEQEKVKDAEIKYKITKN